MSDARLRELERLTGQGDAQARASLIVERARAGKCPWCGEAGAMHAFTRLEVPEGEDADYDAACCCAPCFESHGISNDGMCPGCPGARA